jgi:hypothetical protein
MCKVVEWDFINNDSVNIIECKCKYGHINKIDRDIFIQRIKKDMNMIHGTAMYCFECHDGW